MRRGILIDPFERKIKEVEVGESFRDIYPQIGADSFDCVTLSRDDEHEETAYVDGEGLFRQDQRFFLWVGYDQPLGGKCLIMGTDRQGESVPSRMPLLQVVSHVRWFGDLSFAGADQQRGVVDHPAFGETMTIRSIPKFEGGDDYELVPARDSDIVP